MIRYRRHAAADTFLFDKPLIMAFTYDVWRATPMMFYAAIRYDVTFSMPYALIHISRRLLRHKITLLRHARRRAFSPLLLIERLRRRY